MGRKTVILAAFGFGLAMILQVPAVTAKADPAENALQKTAEEAAIYGFPMIQGYGLIYDNFVNKDGPEYKCALNHFYHAAKVATPNDKSLTTPNLDVLVSMFCADLRAEPVVLTVPEVEGGRYYSGELFDLYSFNYGNVGTRTTGSHGGTYLVAGPSWKGDEPKGISKTFRCETDFTVAVFRTQLFNPSDLAKVKDIQARYRLETLSSFLNGPSPPAAPVVKWPKIDPTLLRTNSFQYLNFVLQYCPAVGAAEVEKPLRTSFAKIGIRPGQPFALDRLTADDLEFVNFGIRHGLDKIKAEMESVGTIENGWRVVKVGFGGRDDYKGDWKLRAAASMAGIYGDSPSEVLCPFVVSDNQGNKPDCSMHRYSLTFKKGQLPAVNAFWSLTMYDGKSRNLVENPLKRYLINSRTLPELKANEDGSVTIYVQKDSPGKEKESNWLPAPDGPIYLLMRLYWPKKEALDGEWTPPVLKAVDK